MKILSTRLFLAFAVALFSLSSLQAQSIVLEINWSNLSAVTFTATTANSFNDYSGTSTLADGLDLVDFFTEIAGNDTGLGVATSTSLYAGSASSLFLNRLVIWDYASEGNDPTRDLNIYLNGLAAQRRLIFPWPLQRWGEQQPLI